MFNITATGINEAIQRLSNADPNKLQRALRSAVMRTLRGARREASRRIAQRYTIAAGHVTRTIKLTASGLSGEMTSRGSRNKSSLFVLRPKSRPRKMPPGGVFIMNVKGQGGNIRRAFIQKNGEPYERTGQSRFPIRRLSGPSAPGMLGSDKVAPFIVRKMEERLMIEIEHEVAALGFF